MTDDGNREFDLPPELEQYAAPEPAKESPVSVETVLFETGFPALTKNSSADEIESVLRDLASRVKGMDPLKHVTIREAAKNRLYDLGVKSPDSLVRAALSLNRNHDDDAKQGRPIILTDPEPWPEPVNGAQLLNALVRALCRHVVISKEATYALALFVIHSHALDAATISPIICLSSPEKRCGKTLVLEILGALVRRPLPASNVTPAACFRAVEKYQPALLIDEADTFLTQNDELRGVLNSSHNRATAVVIRTVGDEHEARSFLTWCAKAVAVIGDLPDTLADRSIILRMRRRSPHEKVERLRRDRLNEQLEPLRRKAARWARDNLPALRTADPGLPDSLDDRAQDNWRPLVAIADAAGGRWSKRARQAAAVLSGSGDQERSSAGSQLLADLRVLFRDAAQDRLPSEEIVNTLAKMEDRPWPEWKNGKPITPTQLARLLKRYGIRPRQVWTVGQKNVRGYILEDFVDTFSRFLPPFEPLGPLEPNNDAGLIPSSDSLGPEKSSGSKNELTHCEQRLLAGLADEKGGSTAEVSHQDLEEGLL